MSIQADDINDLAIGTLNELGRKRWNDISTALQNFQVFNNLLSNNKVVQRSGKGISRNLQFRTTGNARNVGLFETDDTNVGETMKVMEIPWRHTETSWAFDVREPDMNSGPELIFETIATRRNDSMVDLAELMENDFWRKPATSADKKTPFGVQYWIVKTGASEGFFGGDPAGFPLGAGDVLVADVPNWRNYQAEYEKVTKDDLIRKMRTGHRKTNFQSPTRVSDYRMGGQAPRYSYYTDDVTIGLMEEIGEGQNENLGNDLASKDGLMTFRGHPIVYTAELDSVTDVTNPIYAIDFRWFMLVALKGNVMRETPPKVAPNQHNVRESFIDISWNILCTNRRHQQIFAKA